MGKKTELGPEGVVAYGSHRSPLVEKQSIVSTGRLVGVPKRPGAPPSAHSAIRWCEREGNIADVIIVIEGFYNG